MNDKKKRRAEAVERLEGLHYKTASDMLNAILGWGHEPHMAEEARRMLIDLLTDEPKRECPYYDADRHYCSVHDKLTDTDTPATDANAPITDNVRDCPQCDPVELIREHVYALAACGENETAHSLGLCADMIERDYMRRDEADMDWLILLRKLARAHANTYELKVNIATLRDEFQCACEERDEWMRKYDEVVNSRNEVVSSRNDGLAPENGVTAEHVGANDGNVDSREFVKLTVSMLSCSYIHGGPPAPYYGIIYREGGEEYNGYGTFSLDVLSDYLREYFIGAASLSGGEEVDTRVYGVYEPCTESYRDASAEQGNPRSDEADASDHVPHDTREKLEADVRNKSIRPTQNIDCTYDDVLRWLDRQAAISERECSGRLNSLDEYIDGWDLPSAASVLRAYERGELLRDVDRDCDVEIAVQDLKAEIDEWRDNAKDERAKRYAMQRERDTYRELCGKLLDAAHEMERIGTLVDINGEVIA